MQIDIPCWVAWAEFIWYFCINGTTTVKWYDIPQMSWFDLNLEITQTRYFDENNNEVILAPGDVITHGACRTRIDPEVVCVSNDGWTTIIHAIAHFDTSTYPVTVTIYDYNWTLLTWYTVVDCEEKKYDIEKWGDFCYLWELITRYDVIDPETQLVVNSYWLNALWIPQTPPPISALWPRPCGSWSTDSHAIDGVVFSLDGVTNTFTYTFTTPVDGVTIQNHNEFISGVFFRVTITPTTWSTLSPTTFFVTPGSSEDINFDEDINNNSIIQSITIQAVVMTHVPWSASTYTPYTWTATVVGKITWIEY